MLIVTASFNFRAYFSTPLIFRANVQAFRLTLLLWWQKLTWLSRMFLKICKVLQFNFAFAVSFHSTSSAARFKLTVTWFLWTNHNSFATRSNQLDCFTLYRQLITLKSFSCRVCQSGQRPAFELCWKILKYIKKLQSSVVVLFPYYIKQMYSILPCICSVIDYRRRQVWYEQRWHPRLSLRVSPFVLTTF